MQSSLESSQITLTGRFGGASRCIKKDGVPYNVRGVTIFTVEGGEIKAGRLFMEPVEETGLGIDATVE